VRGKRHCELRTLLGPAERIVVYALTASSGRVTTWNFGPVTVSMAAAVRRSLSVETTIDQA
jgi:hypothetical protein